MAIKSELSNIKKVKSGRMFRGKVYKNFSDYIRAMQDALQVEREGDKMSIKNRYGWTEESWQSEPSQAKWTTQVY